MQKVDLVYMWVDGNDPEWRAKRNQYINGGEKKTTEGVNDARWRDNEELRYSLRSVEMYASWINHIYIITDGQSPEWLDVNHPKITIVDHKDILPADALPVFNSQAIESCIHKIEGLSEHFIVGNDDTMFVRPTSPATFFNEGGSPIVRLMRFNRKKALRRGNYYGTIYRMQEFIKECINKEIYLAPHHNFDAYLKSDYRYCVENLYAEEWQATAHHRFRHDKDMQRVFVSYYMVAVGHATMRKVGRYNNVGGFFGRVKAALTNRFANDSRVINNHSKDYFAQLAKYNPIMICANDSERAKPEDGKRMAEFLKELYPAKSSFEK